MTQPKLILASQSKTRKGLLDQLGVVYSVVPAHIDETALKHEAPLAYVKRIALAKAKAVSEAHPDCVVLAADTPVIVGRRILQTPKTREEAADMLRLQSGRKVHVPTVVVVADKQGKLHHKISENWLKMKRLSETEIQTYLDFAPWNITSGAIKLEFIEPWVIATYGTASGTLGLPLYETSLLLHRAGIQTRPFTKGEKAA